MLCKGFKLRLSVFVFIFHSTFGLLEISEDSDKGPPYDSNHTALGCPASLPCVCHYAMTPHSDIHERVVNCSKRDLDTLPSFLELTGYMFDKILLDNNRIKSIPKNAFRGPTVKYIDLSNNSISSVSDNAFMDADGVEELHMENCNLATTPVSLQFLTHLNRLVLYNNTIQQLTPAAFESLHNLRYLDLSHNPLQFPSPFVAFNNLTKLRGLRLEGCSLPNLPVEVFSHALHLETLILRHNNISAIPKNAFENMHKIKELDLEGNPIVFEDFSDFKVLRHLKSLKLGHCHIDTVNAHLVRSVLQVHTLVLKHCHIKKIAHGAFRELTKLAKLDISGNPKVRITDGIFHGCEERLKSLVIENMNITIFPAHQLRKLFLLKKVKANKNVIKELPKAAFRGLKSQNVEIHLDKNEISNIEIGVLHSLRTPVKLYLRHNQITSLEFLSQNICDFYGSELHLEDNPVECDCEMATLLQNKSVNIHGTCHENSVFQGLMLAPSVGKPLSEGYMEMAAVDECSDFDLVKVDQRFDCACGEWLFFNSTQVCDGQDRIIGSHGMMFTMISITFTICSLLG